MVRLPVSGAEVEFRLPDGEDDLALLESRGNPVDQALLLLSRLAQLRAVSDLNENSWDLLTIADFEFGLLALRRHAFGDAVECVFACQAAGCIERIALDFSALDLMNDVHPARPDQLNLIPAKPGWFSLKGSASVFRLPTARDQASVFGMPDAEAVLARACISPPLANRRKRARIEQAMSRLAPEVSRLIKGQCPTCGHELSMTLNVPQLVVEEFRRSASSLHDDVHLLAHAYHWDERTILAMPRVRRQTYSDRIRSWYREAS
jgi:hypothetical protein